MSDQQSAADAAFERLGKRYVDEAPGYSPVSATWLGDHRYDDRLDEITVEAKQQKAAFCRGCLDELGPIPREQLSRANRVDAAMLEHRLRAEVWHIEQLREWTWNPMNYTGLAGSSIYTLMAREFAPLAERLNSAAARLEQFPRMLEQVRAILDPPRAPKVHATTAVKQNAGAIRIMEEFLTPHLDELPAPERKRLEAAMRTARSAVEEHQQWLEGELLPRAEGDFRIGADLFDTKLAFALNTPLSRADVRERAESEMARTRAEMYEVAAEVYCAEHPYTKLPASPSAEYRQAIIRAALEMAYAQRPDPQRIVEQAREGLQRVTDFVRDKDLVTLPPDPVEIIVMPEFRRGTSLAYCDSPGPLDVGQKTFYAIAPPPADWTDKQLRSLLREYCLRSLENLTVHEAMPGHFLQLTHSNRYPSTLRAMLSSGTFIEGWAVYTERMVGQAGLFEGDPLRRLIVQKWYLRGIANALMDQAIHVDGMTEQEAMELMIERTFQEEREAAGKWVRAQLTSAQLSTYFVGYLEHAALRKEVEAAWGDGFSLKRYHDTLLSFGSPTPRYVRALMLDLPIE